MSDVEGHTTLPCDDEPLVREYQGRSGDPDGGPYVELRFKVIGDHIVETSCESNGCPAAQKAAYGLATFLRRRTIEQATRLDGASLAVLIGGLPEGKENYAVLAVDALRAALKEQIA